MDEFRSLRSIPLDFKISVDSLLAHCGIDTGALRKKYGRQALRGYVPEVKKKKQKDVFDVVVGAGDSDEEDDEARIVELDDSDEVEWGKKTLVKEEVARWLDARANDG